MKDLEKLKEKYPNKHASILGFEQPEGFSDHSRKLIREKLTTAKQKKTSVQPLRTLFASLAIAASLVLLFTLSPTPDVEDTTATDPIEEDVFVTSLLLNTLLLEEEALDKVIQESLLDNFEENLALN